MSAERRGPVSGRRLELAKLSLYALVALGSLGLGVLSGESNLVLIGVVAAAGGATEVLPVDRATDHLCETDKQRRQFRWAGVFVILIGALAYTAVLL
jgi:hypothetical protein